MIPGDNVGPEERLAPLMRRPGYPWVLAVIAGLLLAFGLVDAVTQWGEERDALAVAEVVGRVAHRITLSCGF